MDDRELDALARRVWHAATPPAAAADWASRVMAEIRRAEPAAASGDAALLRTLWRGAAAACVLAAATVGLAALCGVDPTRDVARFVAASPRLLWSLALVL